MNTTLEAPRPAAARQFPPFSLSRLLKTVFDPRPGERVCILIDLAEPRQMADYAFLQNPQLTIQRHAHDTFFQALKNGVAAELNLKGGEMYAYQLTGGSNLDLPDSAFDAAGRELSLVDDVLRQHHLVLCI